MPKQETSFSDRKKKCKTKKPGMHWRTLAWNEKTGQKVEQDFKPKDNVQFDELVIDDWLHIEQMDTHNYWMSIGDAAVNVTIRNGKCHVSIERDQY